MDQTRRKPPIKLLPAFEAAARHKNFRKAAEELHVTPSAISQQIKSLESFLNQDLFRRTNRNVELTEAGKQFCALATRTLQVYEQGYEKWVSTQSKSHIRVSALSQIGVDVLFPALRFFQAKHPEISIHISLEERVVSLQDEAIDIGVRIGPPALAEAEHAIKLCDLSAVAVAAPYFIRSHGIESVADIKGAALIHPRTSVNDWQFLAERLNIDISENPILNVESTQASITAVKNGLGVGIGILPLIKTHIDCGAMKIIGEPIAHIRSSCYLVFNPRLRNEAEVEAVLSWIKGEFIKLHQHTRQP